MNLNPLEQLACGLRQLAIPHDKPIIEKFRIYLDFLQTENQKLNLTSLRTPRDIIVHHFFGSLLPLQHSTLNIEHSTLNIVDIGSGAGFPGVPLAILSPHSQFLLIESTSKKCAFLRALIARLDLKNVSILNERAETAAHQSHLRERFDIALSRAVAKVAPLAELMLPFVTVGGRATMYKSKNVEAEVERAMPAIALLGGQVAHIEPHQIPLSNQTTVLVILEKVAATPVKYPRRPGIPQKRPLPR
jgi:16S rRNA (guanine527-N7)-methyltransferase